MTSHMVRTRLGMDFPWSFPTSLYHKGKQDANSPTSKEENLGAKSLTTREVLKTHKLV